MSTHTHTHTHRHTHTQSVYYEVHAISFQFEIFILYSVSILIVFKPSSPHRCNTFNWWRVIITVVLSAHCLLPLLHTISGTFSSLDMKFTATHPLILWKISSTASIIGSARYKQTRSLHLILSKFHFKCFFCCCCCRLSWMFSYSCCIIKHFSFCQSIWHIQEGKEVAWKLSFFNLKWS